MARVSMTGPGADTPALNLDWLLRLRWGALVGQLVTIIVVDSFFSIELPLAPLVTLVTIGAVSNVVQSLWSRRRRAIPEVFIALAMAQDVVLLTGLLYYSGGSFNPFNFLYLVYIALAAVVLQPRWTWALVVLSLVCFLMLFVELPLPMSELRPDLHAEHMHLHLQGMWVAFAVAAVFIVYFVQRVNRALARREAELSRATKLASLATLAAGAAHELATPLSTIAVVSKELALQMAKAGNDAEDVEAIRGQVDRCRRILDQMTADAGQSAGEASTALSVDALVELAVSELSDPGSIDIDIDIDPKSAQSTLLVPQTALAQALRGLLKNACEASGPGDRVTLSARRSGDTLAIVIRDDGHGMSESVLSRVGEPFFTTKDPGRGMGLGLFLARELVGRLDGELAIDSELVLPS